MIGHLGTYYSERAPKMYSSGERRFRILWVSYTTYPLKIKTPNPATTRSAVAENGKKNWMRPTPISPHRPAESIGPIEEKSY